MICSCLTPPCQYSSWAASQLMPMLCPCLSSMDTFRHLYIMTRVSQDFTASVVYRYVTLYLIGASFSLIECASCHRYLEPNGFSAPILLSFVHHWCSATSRHWAVTDVRLKKHRKLGLWPQRIASTWISFFLKWCCKEPMYVVRSNQSTQKNNSQKPFYFQKNKKKTKTAKSRRHKTLHRIPQSKSRCSTEIVQQKPKKINLEIVQQKPKKLTSEMMHSRSRAAASVKRTCSLIPMDASQVQWRLAGNTTPTCYSMWLHYTFMHDWQLIPLTTSCVSNHHLGRRSNQLRAPGLHGHSNVDLMFQRGMTRLIPPLSQSLKDKVCLRIDTNEAALHT